MLGRFQPLGCVTEPDSASEGWRLSCGALCGKVSGLTKRSASEAAAAARWPGLLLDLPLNWWHGTENKATQTFQKGLLLWEVGI